LFVEVVNLPTSALLLQLHFPSKKNQFPSYVSQETYRVNNNRE